MSTPVDFLTLTYNYFLDRINSSQNQGADEGLAKLAPSFAVPVLEFITSSTLISKASLRLGITKISKNCIND